MLETGSLVDGRYRVLDEVGRGGMSVVYRAINEKANKIWAIKEVRKDGVLDFASVRQGLMAELELLKHLHHPNLPDIIDVIEDEDTLLIVMDYVEGNTLGQRLAEDGAQPQEDVIRWAMQLCDVLGYLHSQEPPVIYRDMKPANVMQRPDGSICLIDFGTVRRYREQSFEDTVCLGTLGYAAPEQFGGRGQTDARTDIYGLGATLYHLLTGVSPAMEPPYYRMPLMREINPALSGGLERIIQICTQENPKDRYQSCAQVRYALEHYEAMDASCRKRQRCRLLGFLAAIVCAFAFWTGGIRFQKAASVRAAEVYEELLLRAELATDYEHRLSYYQQAIAVSGMAGESEAYLEMIDMFVSFYEDDRFTAEEEKLLISLFTQNETLLKEDADSYVELCFKIGCLYWYYYDCGDGGDNPVTRARYAVKWFEKVIDTVGTDSDYENLGMAVVYSEVGNFYTQVTKNITQKDDAGTYLPLFEDLCTLMSKIAADSTEKANVRLELCALTENALEQYAVKFKVDKVTREEITELYDGLVNCLDGIDTVEGSIPDTTKRELQEQLEDTWDAIEAAYGESAQ